MAFRHHFPEGDTLIERYSSVFNCVEINTSFYRPHQKKTYERWAEKTPANFQFSVKMPKYITHTSKLENCDFLLEKFLNEISGLEKKLAVILIQLPPSLVFDAFKASLFFQFIEPIIFSKSRLRASPPFLRFRRKLYRY